MVFFSGLLIPDGNPMPLGGEIVPVSESWDW